jgi:hypothetical protein
MDTQQKARQKTVIRSVALPAQHGGWGFVLEPIVLGMLVAPSAYGALLALAALAVFFTHQPLRIAIKDHLKGRRPARTVWAERFVVGYGTVAVAAFGLVLANNDPDFVVPFLLGGPLMVAQVDYDTRNKGRALAAELMGAASLGSIAPAIAVTGGFDLDAAMVLWLILLARTIPSILYVRARLRVERGTAAAITPVWIIHVISLLGIGALAGQGQAPWLALLAIAILTGRMAIGLSRYRTAQRVQTIGFLEMGYGFLTVALVAIGYSIM